jgi:hypothetical protein
MLSSNMLLPNLIPLIDVTFSTPTGHFTQNPAHEDDECNGGCLCAGLNRHEAEEEEACAAMLADVPMGESPIGGDAQVPP